MSDLTTDRINIILQVNGASSYVNNMRQVTGSTDTFNASAGRLMATLSKFISAAVIFNFAKQAKEAWNVQLEAETKLNTILSRNLGTTKEQVQAVKDWASELQKVGVIGDEIQLSGLQELSTYIESADSLKTMNVVLNDMLAQQYGLNATTENAVNIATMLGKVLNGQTSALSRYGYSFDEAQEKLLKYGTEEQRVATLAQVVEASVGGMNEALAKTPAGRLKQISNELGDIKEQFGKAVTNSMVLFVPVLKGIANAFEYISKIAVRISESSTLVKAAQTVKLYGDAWKQASEATKNFARNGLRVIAIGIIAPKVISVINAAVKLLTMEIATLGGVMSAVTGIAGILLMAKAFSDLSKSVAEMRNTADTSEAISNIGNSASVSSEAVDELSEAMDGLTDSTEGLDTFLASFDEINKVGGNNSLMSQLVNTDDLTNILDVADGLEDINSLVGELNGSLDSLDLGNPTIDILEPEWWKHKWELIKGFFATLFNPSEFWENWIIGAEEIVAALKEKFPKITKFFEDLGSKAYNVIHPIIEKIKSGFDLIKSVIDEIIAKIEALANAYENSAVFKYFAGAGSNLYDTTHGDNKGAETFTYTSKSGITSQVLKYNPDGTETELYKKYKSQYNDDGSETELYKRMKRSGSLGRFAAGGLPNKGTLFIAGENGPELVGNFGGNQTKVVNQSQPLSQQYALAQPVLSQLGDRYETKNYSSKTTINNNSDNRLYTNNNTDNRQYTNNTVAGGQAQDITLQIDGRKIATVVIDSINNMTRSSGRSPLVELGG